MLLRMLRNNIWKCLANVKRVTCVEPSSYWSDDEEIQLSAVKLSAAELIDELVLAYKATSEVCATLWQQVLGLGDESDFGSVC